MSINDGNFVFPRAACGFAVMLLVGGCGSADNAYVPPPPPQVTVARPASAAITPILEQNGVIEAVEEADVRARVRGFVQEIRFAPGQKVKRGDVLYRIEPDQYQASVNSAEASLKAAEAAQSVAESLVKVAEAEAKNTRQTLTRERALMQRNAGSQATLDAAVAAADAAAASLDSARANVQAAAAEIGRSEAALAQAKLDLNYTTVRSPIDGRISPTDIKVGNLVENGGKLATVVDRSEVFVNFSVSDREMLEFMQAERAKVVDGGKYVEPDWSTFPVYLRRELDTGFPFVGVLDYVDQEGIDASTGTLGLRSRHDNPDDQLFPGLFVTVRIPKSDPTEKVLLPEYAVQRDQRGTFVLTVGDQSKVERTAIKTGETVSGWTIVTDGLDIEAPVVIDGLQRARPGLKVTANEQTLNVDDQSLMRGFASETSEEEPETSEEE